MECSDTQVPTLANPAPFSRSWGLCPQQGLCQLFLIKPQSFTPLEQPSSLPPTAKLSIKKPLKDFSKARHKSLLAPPEGTNTCPFQGGRNVSQFLSCLSCNCCLVSEILQHASSSHDACLGLEPHPIPLEPSTRAHTLLCTYVQMFH